MKNVAIRLRSGARHGDDPCREAIPLIPHHVNLALPVPRCPGVVTVRGGKLYFLFTRYGGGVASSIARANADGTGLDTAFVPGVTGSALAVDAEHLYWTQGQTRSIARSNLDGSHVDQHFLGVRAQGLAVAAGHIFWASYPTGVIGRASLDGTHVKRRFLRRVKRAHTLAVIR